MLALLGPSGCGKSSTVKMAAGIEEVSAGEIFFGDRPVSELTPKARNIAMVFEDYALYPHLTVRENVSFPLQVQGLPSADIKTRVDEVLDLLGLHSIADHSVNGLSGGAQQRIGIGRALVRDPELILFDEPSVPSRCRPEDSSARRDQTAAEAQRRDLDPGHPRSNRGDRIGRPDRGDEQRRAAAGGDAARTLRAAGQHLRRQFHRRAAHEHPAAARAGRRPRDRRHRLAPQA